MEDRQYDDLLLFGRELFLKFVQQPIGQTLSVANKSIEKVSSKFNAVTFESLLSQYEGSYGKCNLNDNIIQSSRTVYKVMKLPRRSFQNVYYCSDPSYVHNLNLLVPLILSWSKTIGYAHLFVEGYWTEADTSTGGGELEVDNWKIMFDLKHYFNPQLSWIQRPRGANENQSVLEKLKAFCSHRDPLNYLIVTKHIGNWDLEELLCVIVGIAKTLNYDGYLRLRLEIDQEYLVLETPTNSQLLWRKFKNAHGPAYCIAAGICTCPCIVLPYIMECCCFQRRKRKPINPNDSIQCVYANALISQKEWLIKSRPKIEAEIKAAINRNRKRTATSS